MFISLADKKYEKIVPDACNIITSAPCHDVSEKPNGQILVGRNRGFDVCNIDGGVCESVELNTGCILCIQHYDEFIYALHLELESKREVIVFDSNTLGEIKRWALPDYKHMSKLVVVDNKVYVSDPYNLQLCVYSVAGSLITIFHHSTFNAPDLICVSAPESIIVSDKGANKVHKLNAKHDTVTWTCTDVKASMGVCCDTVGNVLAWSELTRSIYIISSMSGISNVEH